MPARMHQRQACLFTLEGFCSAFLRRHAPATGEHFHVGRAGKDVQKRALQRAQNEMEKKGEQTKRTRKKSS